MMIYLIIKRKGKKNKRKVPMNYVKAWQYWLKRK